MSMIPHRPALVEEVVAGLSGGVRGRGGVFVDGTIGSGGHAEALLLSMGEGGRIVGIDCDDQALGEARRRLARFGERAVLVHGRYEALPEILGSLGIREVTGMLLDLGVSSMHLDVPERGFSFREEGPLDMRMDRSQRTTALSILARSTERELICIFEEFGEERFSRRIARAIVEGRKGGRLDSTRDLALLVEGAVPRRAWPRGIHPATRVFQALRIAVNRELESLGSFLASFPESLSRGGRTAIISYQSLEDRMVKQAFRARAADLRVVTRRPVRPSADEVQKNPRARSARLRIAERL